MLNNWRSLLSGRKSTAVSTVSLEDACFDADDDIAKMIIVLDTVGDMKMPRILRVSAAARRLHEQLGIDIVIGDARKMMARTPSSFIATIARNCNLLSTTGFFCSTLGANGVMFTAVGHRLPHSCRMCDGRYDCQHQQYIIHFQRESFTDRLSVLGNFDMTTDAKALCIDRDGFPQIVRATPLWLRMVRPPNCQISHLAPEFLPSIFSAENIARISQHWADALRGVYYDIVLTHNERKISGRIYGLSNDLFFIVLEDVTGMPSPDRQVEQLQDELRTVQSELEERNRIIQSMQQPMDDDNSSSVHSGSSFQSNTSASFAETIAGGLVHLDKLPPTGSHMPEFERIKQSISALPLNTPDDKVRVFLFQMTVAVYARASTADVEATAQLGAYILRCDDGFFVNVATIPSTTDMISGETHQLHPEIMAFYRQHLYIFKDDDFWTAMLDEHALTFVVRHNGAIVGAQTVKICHTILGDPVFYVCLVASVSGNYDRPSRIMATQLKRFACSFIEVGSVAHILAQSVGYRYVNRSGVVHVVKHSVGERGRYYWCKHLDADDAAMLMGAQFATFRGYAEGDCQFMHKELRRML